MMRSFIELITGHCISKSAEGVSVEVAINNLNDDLTKDNYSLLEYGRAEERASTTLKYILHIKDYGWYEYNIIELSDKRFYVDLFWYAKHRKLLQRYIHAYVAIKTFSKSSE